MHINFVFWVVHLAGNARDIKQLPWVCAVSDPRQFQLKQQTTVVTSLAVPCRFPLPPHLQCPSRQPVQPTHFCVSFLRAGSRTQWREGLCLCTAAASVGRTLCAMRQSIVVCGSVPMSVCVRVHVCVCVRLCVCACTCLQGI